MNSQTKSVLIHDIGHSRLIHAIVLVACIGLLNEVTHWHHQDERSGAPPLPGYATSKKMDGNIFRPSGKIGLPKDLMPVHGLNTCTAASGWNDCEGIVVDFDAGTIQDYSLTGTDDPKNQKFSGGATIKLSPQQLAYLIAAANRDWNPGPPVPWNGGWTTGLCSVQLFDGDTARNDDFSPSCLGSAVLNMLDKIKEEGNQPSQ